jgi:hypothetical protein
MEGISFVQLVVAAMGFLGTAVVGVLSYFVRGVMDQVKEQQKELNSLHEKYVKKDDFGTFKTELWNRFDRLEDHLANQDVTSKRRHGE